MVDILESSEGRISNNLKNRLYDIGTTWTNLEMDEAGSHI
jgi:hypothetical protein